MRIPVGAVVGHTFELDHGMELHAVRPSTALARRLRGERPLQWHQVDVEVDVGVSYGITQQIAYGWPRCLGTTYAGSSNAIGFSLAWTPKGLKKF